MRITNKIIEIKLTPIEIYNALKSYYSFEGELENMYDGDYEEPIEELSIVMRKQENV